METELLSIYDENRNYLGVATRQDVHQYGHWHETFHCWFICNEKGTYYLYFQLRSEFKKDYPSLLDITAAGHILAHEKIEDGVREVKEETGIDVQFPNLIPLGIIPYQVSIEEKNFFDKEFAHVFLFHYRLNMDCFKVQRDEVAGMVRASITDCYDLWFGDKTEIHIEGFRINQLGERVFVDQMATEKDFVPHEPNYYRVIFDRIHQALLG
jgi:isopentenyldiphosphate isomerase